MVLRDEFLMLDLKKIVFAVFYDVLVQFAHAYWVFSSFFFNHAPRVFSQWTRTGKPTNDFSWLFNVNLPPQLGPSREHLFIWVEATFIIYKIHSMIHCCSTLNSFFCQTEIENQSHRKFISHVNKLIIWKLSNVLSKAAFNVETVNVKTLYQLHSSYFR